MPRPIHAQRPTLQIVQAPLSASINWGLIGSLIANCAFWGGLAALLWRFG
jgi:hypothetical protein